MNHLNTINDLLEVVRNQNQNISYLSNRISEYNEHIQDLETQIKQLEYTNKDLAKQVKSFIEKNQKNKTCKLGDHYITEQEYYAIEDALRQEKLIQAIKLYREYTNTGLKEAINTIKHLQRDMKVPF